MLPSTSPSHLKSHSEQMKSPMLEQKETSLIFRKGRIEDREQQTGESHFCAWENHAADPPRKYFRAHKR